MEGHAYGAELLAAVSAVRRAARISRGVMAAARAEKAKSEAASPSDDAAQPPPGPTNGQRAAADRQQDPPPTQSVDSKAKKDLSPVTVADFAVQALLTSALHHAFPGDGFVGEESAEELRRDGALRRGVWDALAFAGEEEVRPADVLPPNGSVKGARSADLPASQDDMCDLIDVCGSGQGGSRGRVWIFDPIDGTHAYMFGGLHAINVGLLVDGVQRLGVVGCPNFDPAAPAGDGDGAAEWIRVDNDSVDTRPESEAGCVVWAVRDAGAWIAPLSVPDAATLTAAVTREEEADVNGTDTRVAVSSPPPPTTPPTISILQKSVRLPRHADGFTDVRQLRFSDWYTPTPDSAFVELHALIAQTARDDAAAAAGSSTYRYPDSDLLSAVMKYVLLGLGRGATATLRVYKKRSYRAKVWDHAGASLVFEEVGGKVTDVDGRPLDLGRGRQLVGNYGLVAAPAPVHADLLRVVRDVLRREGKEELLGELWTEEKL